MGDFLFRGLLAEYDPQLSELIEVEAERQDRKLILIASESTAPMAVREALSSSFQNIYAEGYPDEETRKLTEAEILDYSASLNHYRRYSDPRYYKGVEYADIVEALARRRCAELLRHRMCGRRSFVNVQALSGAAIITLSTLDQARGYHQGMDRPWWSFDYGSAFTQQAVPYRAVCGGSRYREGRLCSD
jgi:glycine hydroxymethyltransferase